MKKCLKKRCLSLILILCLSGMMTACQPAAETPAGRIEQDVNFLCSDECGGRMPGTKGNDLARDYIQEAFETAGLVPLEGWDSLLVPYEQTVFDMEHLEQTVTAFFPDGSSQTFQAGTDFFPILDQNFTEGFSAEVTTDPLDPDIKNKVYLSQNGDSSREAIATVQGNGKGYCLVMHSVATQQLNCSSEMYERIAECSTLSLEGATAFLDTMVDNVVGVLPCGNENAAEALLISAHFDHVGGFGDTIYRGALDNASGASLMLEIMRQLSATGNTAEYDIVFAAFNGEDMGLLGSDYLASRLPYSTVNVINVDCVGYKEESAVGIEGENSALQAAVVSAFGDESYCSAFDLMGGSDHKSFEKLGIPAVNVSTRTNDIDAVIHQTVDTPDVLDFESMAAMVDPLCQYALTAELIQPEPEEEEQFDVVVDHFTPALFAQAREQIDAVGLAYDKVLPLELNGEVYFARDIGFLADADAVEALISPVKLPESLDSFALDRTAPLHGSSYGDDTTEYHVQLRTDGPDDVYEIGVPQDVTNRYDKTSSWHLKYTDGDVSLTLNAFDSEVMDVESIMSGEETDQFPMENGVLYRRFSTWEGKQILQAVSYAEEGLPYFFVLYNSTYVPTSVDSDVLQQMMIDIIPSLREIPKLP